MVSVSKDLQSFLTITKDMYVDRSNLADIGILCIIFSLNFQLSNCYMCYFCYEILEATDS